MNRLSVIVLLASVCLASYICPLYDAYILSMPKAKCYENDNSSGEECNGQFLAQASEFTTAYDVNCAYLLSLSDGHTHSPTILTDYTDSKIQTLSDIYYKYTGIKTTHPEITGLTLQEKTYPIQSSAFSGVPNRYDQQQFDGHSTFYNPSWAFALSYALTQAGTNYLKAPMDPISPVCILLQIADTVVEKGRGMSMDEMMNRVIDRGVVTIASFNSQTGTTAEKCNSAPKVANIKFNYKQVEEPNKSGLIDLFESDYVPLVALSLDMKFSRYMKTTLESEPYLTELAEDPSMYAVIRGFSLANENWHITGNFLPNLPIDVFIPMSPDETSTNTMGIAAYAIGVFAEASIEITDTPDIQAAGGATEIIIDSTNCNWSTTWDFSGAEYASMTHLYIGPGCENRDVTEIIVTGRAGLRILVAEGALCQAIEWFGLEDVHTFDVSGSNFNNDCTVGNVVVPPTTISIEDSTELNEFIIRGNSFNTITTVTLNNNEKLRTLFLGVDKTAAGPLNVMTDLTVMNNPYLTFVKLSGAGLFPLMTQFVLDGVVESGAVLSNCAPGSLTTGYVELSGSGIMPLVEIVSIQNLWCAAHYNVDVTANSFAACTDFHIQKMRGGRVTVIDLITYNSFNAVRRFGIITCPQLDHIHFTARNSFAYNPVGAMDTTYRFELTGLTNLLNADFDVEDSIKYFHHIVFSGLRHLRGLNVTGSNSFQYYRRLQFSNIGNDLNVSGGELAVFSMNNLPNAGPSSLFIGEVVAPPACILAFTLPLNLVLDIHGFDHTSTPRPFFNADNTNIDFAATTGSPVNQFHMLACSMFSTPGNKCQ